MLHVLEGVWKPILVCCCSQKPRPTSKLFIEKGQIVDNDVSHILVTPVTEGKLTEETHYFQVTLGSGR